MASVKAFGVPGVKMIIYSGDHEPPHIHARRSDDWEAKVYILESVERMIEILKPPGARMSRADRRAITQGIETYRPQLLNEWEQAQADD